MTEAVSAAASDGTRATARATPTQITEKVIQASLNDASLLQKSIPGTTLPEIRDANQYFLVI